MKVTVNNLPSHPISRWVVARFMDNSLWYYGTWDSKEEADKAAESIGGIVTENMDGIFDALEIKSPPKDSYDEAYTKGYNDAVYTIRQILGKEKNN